MLDFCINLWVLGCLNFVLTSPTLNDSKFEIYVNFWELMNVVQGFCDFWLGTWAMYILNMVVLI